MKFGILRLFLTSGLISVAASLTASAQGILVDANTSSGGSTLASKDLVQNEGISSILIDIEQAGTYVITISEANGFSLSIDGTFLVAANGLRQTAITSLTSGTHAVAITGMGVSDASFDAVSIHRSGFDNQVPLASLSAVDGEAEASNLRQSTASIRQNGEGAAEGSRVATNISNILSIGRDLRDPELPVIVPEGGAVSSPLSPPQNVSVTQAVEIVGGASDDGLVASSGQTLFGRVQDFGTYDSVDVSIDPSGRTTSVEVGPTTGQFAVRLFPEDMTAGSVTVSLIGVSTVDTSVVTEAVEYSFEVASNTDGVVQALSRLTYGPTPELYSRVRAIGYEAYVNEQLSPETINNNAFDSMNFDELLDRESGHSYYVRRSLERHNFAHAVFSEKQLQEVMGEFWSNHFHASTKKNSIHQQNIIDRIFYRENAMGRFEDLLLYSAESPLMSQFLDNDESSAGELNENYGREILELHTLGASAGYSQEDVVAAARVFTGWNYLTLNPNFFNDGETRHVEFEFREGDHDTEDKFFPFLDLTISGRSGAAGVEEGRELITILANHPNTRSFVCGKIVQHFVADVPPQNLVDVCVSAWEGSDGSSREILRAILLDPSFIGDIDNHRNKVKTPFEYLASMLRYLGAETNGDHSEEFYKQSLTAMEEAGYQPTSFTVPTGLPEVSSAWANSASLLARYAGANFHTEHWYVYNIDTPGDLENVGLETAEEYAAYLLTVATGDRFRRDEFEAIVDIMKTSGSRKAVSAIMTFPSFQLQ